MRPSSPVSSNSAETARHESEPLEMFDRRAVDTASQAVQALQLEYVDPVYSLDCSVEMERLLVVVLT